MIVDPDFPDHWKTRMLVDLLDGDEAAPVYLLRLWAHCQNRKTASFENLPAAALKALCRFPGHANKFESSLAASGFVRREGQTLTACGWEEYNAALLANWQNGKKGGRPPKPKPNPSETHGIPMDNPQATHGEPIREEESREEFRERDTAGAGIRRPTLDQAKSAASQLGITAAQAEDWWNAREASDWMKGAGGGATTPVGSNWQADLRTYTTRMSEHRGGQNRGHRTEKAAQEFPETSTHVRRL